MLRVIIVMGSGTVHEYQGEPAENFRWKYEYIPPFPSIRVFDGKQETVFDRSKIETVGYMESEIMMEGAE